MSQDAGLISTNGKRIALQSVHIEGQVDGLLASMTITQRYRNHTGKKLEVVYTFPLPWGAVLLSMDVTLGTRRMQGALIERETAQERYEESLTDGDTPVLVEQSASGLYTVNLGNIEDGENVAVELRYAQLLHCEHASLRLCIPCVIAQRYGDQHHNGGLAVHENADSDTLAEYPLTLRVFLRGKLSKAGVSCPSHTCGIEKVINGTVVSLTDGAFLDRDFILNVSGLEQQSFVMAGPDIDGRFLMLAGFCPPMPQSNPRPLLLKILADCSGSMAGNSITSVKAGLLGLMGMWERGDYISYSRFGDTVQHETGGFLTYSMDNGGQLCKAFNEIDADMGGTELQSALLSTLNDIPLPPITEKETSLPCVLLITDGAVWEVEEIIRTCRASNQRIFAIGVGSAPAESLLRELARETGGACELVSPNESIVEAVRRMVDRMRGPLAESMYMDWGTEPVWQSALPRNLYHGEMAHIFASFAKPPVIVPVLHWRTDGEAHSLKAEEPDTTWNDAITRLAGAVRLRETDNPEEARNLALKCQLVSKHTALFLVHEREGEKSQELPELHQVPQMNAAGHGGFGTVRRGWLRNIHEPDATSFLETIRFDPNRTRYEPTPLDMLQSFEKKALSESRSLYLMHLMARDEENFTPGQILDGISAKTGLPIHLVWALFLDWLLERVAVYFTLSDHARGLLLPLLSALAETMKDKSDAAKALIEKEFARVSLNSWGQPGKKKSRKRRLESESN